MNYSKKYTVCKFANEKETQKFNSSVNFWSWFQDNVSFFAKHIHQPKVKKCFVDWLETHLNYYCKGLGFRILFSEQEVEPHQLWISANGNHIFFPAVQNLVHNAPKMENWKFTAFIPGTVHQEEEENSYSFEEKTLQINDVYFRVINIQNLSNKLDIVIYIPNLEEFHDQDSLASLIVDMLQSYFGEIITFKIIHTFKLKSLDFSITNPKQVFKLTDLHAYYSNLLTNK
ncbi:MAG: hypothetical protein LAT51_13625 [Flavobacteriaceae bacterium]|nr:hypothetical protein [Flavobacteriaceae bacterium]